jgi:NADH-quinone oxidoreductase subunit K
MIFLNQLTVNVFLYIIGLFGIVFNRRSILIVLMCVELMLLSLNLNFIVFSTYFDDLYGQIFSFFILTVAAAESAVGLAIIIAFYRNRGNIDVEQPPVLRY